MNNLLTAQSPHHKPITLYIGRLFMALILTAQMTACASTVEQLERIGQAPELTDIRNPKLDPEYREVTMPMPEKYPIRNNINSLWSANRQSFYKNTRPSDIGDILTVVIMVDDEATLENSTESTRNNDNDFDMPGLLGLETQLTKVLPEGTTPDNLINLGSARSDSGDGTIERKEEIEIRMAALITQKLPNDNLVIHGRQEMRVNHEVREIQISGVIRPEDINTRNEINYDKIAEVRLSYGGRGTISDVQAPRYGTQILDILMPF